MKKVSLLTLLLSLFTFAAFAGTPSTKFVILDDDDDDAQIVAQIFATLMNAEQIAQPLNIQIVCEESASDQLVFGLRSAEVQNVQLTLVDAVSRGTVANREFDIEVGNNYKSLNVSDLPEGNYILTFSRDNKKITKLVGIVRNEEGTDSE